MKQSYVQFSTTCSIIFVCWIFSWRSRHRLGYIRKTNSFCTPTSVSRGGCVGRGMVDNGGGLFHGCENSDHPLIYDDANINFISHCGGSASTTTNVTMCASTSSNHHKNLSNSLICPSTSSTSNTYLIDMAAQKNHQVCK